MGAEHHNVDQGSIWKQFSVIRRQFALAQESKLLPKKQTTKQKQNQNQKQNRERERERERRKKKKSA